MVLSRKKSKGKDRKAKKLEAKRLTSRKRWWGWATGDKKYVKHPVTCGHGFAKLDSVDQPVCGFLDDFLGRDNFSVENLEQALQTIDGKTILKDERYKETVVNIMIRIGTNMLLNGSHANLDGALTLAKSIVVLEYYDGSTSLGTIINSRKAQTKRRDVDQDARSGRRDALKFYSKRTTCSCLKAMHQVARRTLPKMGFCYGCAKEIERVALSVCSRCMIVQYCSRECQVSDWPYHENSCDVYVLSHKRLTADKNAKKNMRLAEGANIE